MNAPTTFTASVGRRRVFLSAADARAYERGWDDHKSGRPMSGDLNTPYSSGWFDAESVALDRNHFEARTA